MISPAKQKIKTIINHRFKGNIPYTRDFAPLYNKDRKIMLSLSAKSGSVYAAKWFFFHSPFWEEAKNYPKWVHKYRQDVFYKSENYEDARQDFWVNPSDYVKIKLVRNPYSRAVSSYIHAIAHPKILSDDIVGLHAEEGLSFAEFIEWLETLNIKKCNPHFRRQTHYFERFANWQYDYLIKLESSKESFANLEQELGLPASSFDELRESKHHSHRHPDNGFVGKTRYPLARAKFSNYIHFYNGELAERVRALYAEDFDTCGYSPEFEPPYA